MSEINTFLHKTAGSSNVSCVITTPAKIKDVEDELLDSGFMSVTNKVDFYTLSEQGKSFFVPVYKLEDLNAWYKIAFDYASGQLYDYEMDRRVNPNYKENNIIFVTYDNDLQASDEKLLDVVGLTLQVK